MSARISRHWVRFKGRGQRVRSASPAAAPASPIRPPPWSKYNVVQKNRREWKHDRKRQAHGEPGTGKLKQCTAPVSMSGKRKRKLQRRQNRVRQMTFSIWGVGLHWYDGSAYLIFI
jgi:hypothetical protein